MQTVGPDQREIGGQKRTAVRAEPLSDQLEKFTDFHKNKSQPQEKRNREPAQDGTFFAPSHGHHDQTIGGAAEE